MSDYLIPVFDLGGVFIDWSPLNLYRNVFDTEEEAIWFVDNIYSGLWNLEFDAGKLYADGIAELCARFPAYRDQIVAYDKRWLETIAGVFDGTVAIHEELIAEDIPTFAITNYSKEKFQLTLENYDFLKKFDGILVSGQEKLVKPDYRIYHRFLERYSLDASSCVFIDDSYPNVVAAEHIGMKAIHFESPEQLREELIELGLPLATK